jgi:hypothetical protein
VDLGNSPARHALKGFHERRRRHRLQILQREGSRAFNESADLKSVISVGDLGVRARDGVNTETVSAGQESAQPGTERVAEEVLDTATKDHPECAQGRHAEEGSASDGYSFDWLFWCRIIGCGCHEISSFLRG